MGIASAEISVTASIDAPASTVWEKISDLQAMGRRSPQCKRMFVFGKPGRMVGSYTLNLNNDAWAWWPTWSVITEWQAPAVLEFRIPINATRWRYTIIPTGDASCDVRLERFVDTDTTWISQFLVKRAFGGNDVFERKLQKGMQQTLQAIKREAEAS